MSVTLQFVADDGGWFDPVDYAIQWYSHGWANHVDAVVHDHDGNEKLLGARMKGGVSIRPTDYQKFRRIQRINIPLPIALEERFYNFIFEQVGKSYDDTAILGFFFGRDWRAEGHWTCSELMAAALEHCAFFVWPLTSPANRITPTDLMLAISAKINVEAHIDVR